MTTQSQRPTDGAIRDFYDSQTRRKLSDFVDGNSLVERAWHTLAAWLPSNCDWLLEVGCGIGAIS